jgi:hypothetical protein
MLFTSFNWQKPSLSAMGDKIIFLKGSDNRRKVVSNTWSIYAPGFEQLCESSFFHQEQFLNTDSENLADFKIEKTPQGLFLKDLSDGHKGTYEIPMQKFFRPEKAAQTLKSSPLIKACGLHNMPPNERQVFRIADACLGWGQDSFILSSLGVKISAYESNPLLGLFWKVFFKVNRSLEKQLAWRFEQKDFLQVDKTDVDCIYLDPMFPTNSHKSALPDKHMQLLRKVVPESSNAVQLLEHAFALGVKRIVMKQPRSGQEQLPPPNFTIKAKSMNFAVYLPPYRA